MIAFSWVENEMVARRVMRSVTKYIEEKLGLIVNMKKSKVTKPNNSDLKFLGFGFFGDYQNRLYKAKPHGKLVDNFKYKLKQLTEKTGVLIRGLEDAGSDYWIDEWELKAKSNYTKFEVELKSDNGDEIEYKYDYKTGELLKKD